MHKNAIRQVACTRFARLAGARFVRLAERRARLAASLVSCRFAWLASLGFASSVGWLVPDTPATCGSQQHRSV